MSYMKSETVTRSYIDHNKRIEEMLKAGVKLEEWRKGHYDYPEGTPDDTDFRGDPTRAPGFDMADASEAQRAIKAKMKAKMKTSKEPSQLATLNQVESGNPVQQEANNEKTVVQEQKPITPKA